MPDATLRIDGHLAADPRYNTTPNGVRVANLRVLAGRSRPDGQGGYETLSTTPYDVACWGALADLATSENPGKGAHVIVTGQIAGVDSYDGPNGLSLSVKVNAEGLRVIPKRDQPQNQQGGYQQAPQQPAPTNDPWQGGANSQQGYAGDPAPF